MTKEHLLAALVTLADTVDLLDVEVVKRVLQINFELQPNPPFLMPGTDVPRVADELKSVEDPGYLFVKLGPNFRALDFYYRRRTSPGRIADLSFGIDDKKVCMDVDDVLHDFKSVGQIKPRAPPISAPAIPGETRVGLDPEIKAYGYWIMNGKFGRSIGLDFNYKRCLQKFWIAQPHR